MLAAMAAVLLVVGCKTVEPEVTVVERVVKDTVRVMQQRVDSVIVKDSVMVTLKGDSTVIERWHLKWRERVLRDTTYVSRVDSVPVAYPVVKEVPAALSWWQKALMWCGFIFIIIVLITVAGKFK